MSECVCRQSRQTRAGRGQASACQNGPMSGQEPPRRDSATAQLRRPPLSDEFSLALGRETARRLQARPEDLLAAGRANLARMREVHGAAAEGWLSQWEQLLAGPITAIVTVLTTDSEDCRQLRQNTPFAGVVPDQERQRLIVELRGRRNAPE